MRVCTADGCTNEYKARGFCWKHYLRARRAGQLSARTPEERFAERFEIELGGCWMWTGHTDQRGYPLLGIKSTTVRAHRWAWEKYVAPLATGVQLHHLCRNIGCVNPDHLEPVTNAENQRRRWEKSYCCVDCGSSNVRPVYVDDLDLAITPVAA